MSIKKELQEILKGFKETPIEINKGRCEDFAMAFRDGDYLYWDDCFEKNKEGDEKLYGHCFIFFEGKFYDSECLNGAGCWRELPYYKRIQSYLV